MKLILKNKSDTVFSYLSNAVVLNGKGENECCSLEVSSKYWIALSKDVNFIKDLRFNNFTINDGISDFEAPASEEIFKRLVSSVAYITTSPQPFAEKVLPNGKKVYTRIHGIKKALAGTQDALEFVIPYNSCKITGIEIINGKLGDAASLRVFDTPTGTISGIENQELNQFGFEMNIAPDFYKYKSDYDADLIKDLKVEVEYTTEADPEGRVVYINLFLHEVKD
jgi:hypothetical protein